MLLEDVLNFAIGQFSDTFNVIDSALKLVDFVLIQVFFPINALLKTVLRGALLDLL